MDKALKQRLVGASVLIAFAVVVLPMLLSGQQGDQQESRQIDLPPKPPEMALETRRFPIGDQPANQPSVLDPPQQAEPEPEESILDSDVNEGVPSGLEQAPPDPVTVQVEPRENVDIGDPTAGVEPDTQAAVDEAPVDVSPAPVEAEPEPHSAPPPAAPVEAPEGRYLVQVASFSSSANANRLAGRLRDNDLPVLMDAVDAQAGRLHRVRVGPYDSQEAANQAIATLNSQMPDLNPRLLDLRPDEMAPVSQPSDPLIRWVVQVGVFGQQNNAGGLVYRLRDAGYRASSEAITRDSGMVYRVVVGPTLERQDAVQLQESIKRDLDIDGLVMSAD